MSNNELVEKKEELNFLKFLEEPDMNQINIQQFLTPMEQDFGGFLTELKDVKDSFFIFNHSHTNFMWEKYNLNHVGLMRNFRQLSAELQGKYRALMENYFKYAKSHLDYKEMLLKKNKLEKKKGIEYTRFMIEFKEKEWQLADSKIVMKGAIKDFTELHKLYTEMQKETGKYSEQDVEKLEARYWIRRLAMQSMRDIITTGRIGQGNQEAVENIGINPLMLEKQIIDFLNINGKEFKIQIRNEFLKQLSVDYEKEVLEYYTYKEFDDKDIIGGNNEETI